MADVAPLMDHKLSELCSRGAFWKAAFAPDTIFRALKVALIVGTILVAINQADIILAGDFPPIWKLLLTYCVPYSVSTYSAAAFKVAFARDTVCSAKS